MAVTTLRCCRTILGGRGKTDRGHTVSVSMSMLSLVCLLAARQPAHRSNRAMRGAIVEGAGVGVPGFCEAASGPGDCSGASAPVGGHHKGRLHFDSANASSCIEACRACERCNFVSLSAGRVCYWFEFCALARLEQKPEHDWQTYQVRERPLVGQLQLSPRSAPTPDATLRAFARRLGPPRRGGGGASSSSSSGSQLALHKPQKGREPLLIVVYGTSVSMGEGPTGASWLSAFPDLLEGKLRRAFPQLEGRPLRVVKRALYPEP